MTYKFEIERFVCDLRTYLTAEGTSLRKSLVDNELPPSYFHSRYKKGVGEITVGMRYVYVIDRYIKNAEIDIDLQEYLEALDV